MRSRKGFIITLTVLILGLAVFVVIRTTAQREEQHQVSQERLNDLEQRERTGWISGRERVELARARGQRQLVVPGVVTNYSLGMPTSPDAANEALSNYTLVIAQLVEKHSYLRNDFIGGTWNKFRVIETLSQTPPQPSHVDWPTVPEEMLPLRENEFVIHTANGTVSIDGVEVTMNDLSLAAFREGQKYLFAISLDPSTRIGELSLGLYSVLPINSDNTLDVRRDREYLQQVIKLYHGGSIEALGNALGVRSGN